jgi:hydroxyethylthiazole kinase-like sugar kinase family protein
MLIQIKHSGNTGNVPVALANGELALNDADQLLYARHANGTILVLANGRAIGTGTDAYARQRANAAFDYANGSAQLSFVTVNVAGQSDVVADSSSDTLTLIGGTGITITTNAVSDTITFGLTGTGAATDSFARIQANAAFDQANAAFAEANTADVLAQSAFDKANGSAQLSFVTLNVA